VPAGAATTEARDTACCAPDHPGEEAALDPLLVVLGVVLVVAGLLGVVIPVLPGLLLVWLGTAGTTVLLHRADGLGWALAAVLTVLFLGGTAATLWLPARQGRRGGAGAWSFVLAAAGAVAGFFLLPIVGFLLGGLGGLLVGERLRLQGWRPAWASTGRVLRAYGVGVLVELGVGLTMTGIWAAAVVMRT
jgi:uncharacterized protein